jgi:hypothetical protein
MNDKFEVIAKLLSMEAMIHTNTGEDIYEKLINLGSYDRKTA